MQKSIMTLINVYVPIYRIKSVGLLLYTATICAENYTAYAFIIPASQGLESTFATSNVWGSEGGLEALIREDGALLTNIFCMSVNKYVQLMEQ